MASFQMVPTVSAVTCHIRHGLKCSHVASTPILILRLLMLQSCSSPLPFRDVLKDINVTFFDRVWTYFKPIEKRLRAQPPPPPTLPAAEGGAESARPDPPSSIGLGLLRLLFLPILFTPGSCLRVVVKRLLLDLSISGGLS